MIELGRGMIFPDSWAYGPPDPPEPDEEWVRLRDLMDDEDDARAYLNFLYRDEPGDPENGDIL